MPNRPRIDVYLVVVAALLRLVAEEVYSRVPYAARLLGLVLQMLETVCLVPARGEHIERDLPTDREPAHPHPLVSIEPPPCRALQQNIRDRRQGYSRQAPAAKLAPKHLHHLPSHAMLQVVFLILIALLRARVPPNRADIDHAVAKLDKRAPLDRDIQVGDVAQHEVDQLLVAGLAQPADEVGRRQRLPGLEGREAVLGEAEVEERRHGDGGAAELLLLLGQVGAADVAHCDLLAQAGEEG